MKGERGRKIKGWDAQLAVGQVCFVLSDASHLPKSLAFLPILICFLPFSLSLTDLCSLNPWSPTRSSACWLASQPSACESELCPSSALCSFPLSVGAAPYLCPLAGRPFRLSLLASIASQLVQSVVAPHCNPAPRPGLWPTAVQLPLLQFV